MTQRRVGIIGTGFMGGVHAEAWQGTNASLVAILEHTKESKIGDMGRFGASVYTDLTEFLNAVDVVDICVPTYLHGHFALAAAAAGKPTICEKPLSLTGAESLEVLEAFSSRGLLLQVAHVLRFSPEYSAARNAVRSGQIGDLASLRLHRLSFAPKRGRNSWFIDEAKSGGIVFDLMIHDLDYALWLAGDVTSVYAKSAVGGPGHAIAILQHENGVMSHVEGSWSEPQPLFRTKAEIAGSTGLIEFSSDASSPLNLRLHQSAEVTTGGKDRSVGANPFELELQHFMDLLDGGVEPVITAFDGLQAVRLAEATRQSVSTGRPVRLTASGRAE
ncbi:MAG: Gfo/Idh/MocA family oxidoreductase [Pseudolysinimonas sp.]